MGNPSPGLQGTIVSLYDIGWSVRRWYCVVTLNDAGLSSVLLVPCLRLS